MSKSKVAVCGRCGSMARAERCNYAFVECGLPGVLLRDVEMVRCAACGEEEVAIPRLNELMRTLALAVLCKPYPLNGKEVRFLRKSLHFSAQELSRLLRIDKTTISKWENGHDAVGPQSDRLLRLLVAAKGEGMQEKNVLDQVVEALGRIEEIERPFHLELNPALHSFEYA